MKCSRDNRKGFSLTEILLAVGVLAIGMVFVAGVFPAGMVLSTRSAERTIAAVVADEAFAKIRLISNNPTTPILAGDFPLGFSESFEFRVETKYGVVLDDEFSYPSIVDVPVEARQYYWSAVCRQVSTSEVQVTVFVCRKVGNGTVYVGGGNRPIAVNVEVSGTAGSPILSITGNPMFVNDGYTIVDSESGRIYRVLSRTGNKITLEYPWELHNNETPAVWVVPPPVTGGRYPCIGVYQKVIRF